MNKNEWLKSKYLDQTFSSKTCLKQKIQGLRFVVQPGANRFYHFSHLLCKEQYSSNLSNIEIYIFLKYGNY